MAYYINGVDRSEHVKRGSTSITSTLYAAIDTASLEINPGGLVIDGGEEIIITDDADGERLFAGHIANPEETGEKNDVGYTIQCQDYTAGLNKLLVLENYITLRDGGGNYYPSSDSRTWTLGKIVRDLISKYAPGYTVTHVVADGPVIDSVGFTYQRLTDALDELKRLTGYTWYVDYNKDLHVFDSERALAPFSLSNTSANFSKLKFSVDRSQIRNRVYIKGGTQLTLPANSQPAQSSPGTGLSTSVFNLGNEPQELLSGTTYTKPAYPGGANTAYGVHASSAYGIIVLRCVHTPGVAGDGYVKENMVVGTNGIHDFYDALGNRTVYNVLVQVDRIPWVKTFSPLPANERLELYYQYRMPILIYAEDAASIAAVKIIEGGDGIYEHIIDDSEIITFDQARNRANAELKQYAQPLVSGSFSTHIKGLATGQTLSIDVTRTNGSHFKGDYLINEVTTKSDGAGWSYEVKFDVNMLDFALLIQQLMKQVTRVGASTNETLDIFLSAPENMTMMETLTWDIHEGP